MKISFTRRVKLVHRKKNFKQKFVCHLMAYILKEIFKRNIFTRYVYIFVIQLAQLISAEI